MKNRKVGRVLSLGLAGVTAMGSTPAGVAVAVEGEYTESSEVVSEGSSESVTEKKTDSGKNSETEISDSEEDMPSETIVEGVVPKKKVKKAVKAVADVEDDTEESDTETEKGTEKETNTEKESDTETETETETDTETETETDTEIESEIDDREEPSCYSLVELADVNGKETRISTDNLSTCYYRDLFLSISAVATVEGDRVSKISILNRNTGEEYYSKDSYVEGEKIIFNIEKDMETPCIEYTIIRDGKETCISQDLNKVVEEFRGMKHFKRETKELSLVEITGKENAFTVIDGVNYLRESGKKFSWKFDISNRDCTTRLVLDDCTITAVDSVGNSRELRGALTSGAEGTIVEVELPSDMIGAVGITVSARDDLGYECSSLLQYYNACVEPEFSGDVEGITVRDGYSYAGSGSGITLSTKEGYLVRSVDMCVDGSVVESAPLEDGSVSFKLNRDGVYTARYTDVFGNVKDIALTEISGDLESANVIVDSSNPMIQFSSSDGEPLSKIFKDRVVVATTITDDNGLAWYSIDVDGDLFEKEFTGSSVTSRRLFDGNSIPVVKNGRHVISVKARDLVGNEYTDSVTVVCDINAPKENGIEWNGNAVVAKSDVGEKCLVVDASDSGKLLAYDDESGVKEIRWYRNGVLVGTGDTIKFEENGEYRVEIEDMVGHVTKRSVGDIFGEKDINKVIVSKESPKIIKSITSDFENGIDFGGKIWFSKEPVLKFKVEDGGSPIKNIKISVNGEDLMLVGDEFGYFTVPVNKLKDGSDVENVLTVDVEDYLGKKDSLEYKFYIDKTAPDDVKVSFDERDKYLVGGTLYSRAPVSGRVSASDYGVGIRSYIIDGVESVSGVFSLGSGTHSVSVIDRLGNVTSDFDIGTLGSIKFSKIVIDSENPTFEWVSGYKTGNTVDGEEWYSKLPDLKFRVSDDNFRSVGVSVNGGDTVYYTESGEYSVDLSDIEDGDVSVRIVAVDEARNRTDEIYSFKYDSTCPRDITAMVSENYIEREGKMFFKSEPVVELGAIDDGVGVGYYLINGKRYISGKFVVSGGTYTVKIADKIGNETREYDLGQLLGMNGSEFVVDCDNPVITRSSGFKPDLIEDGVNWYSSNPNLVYDVSDANLSSVTFRVNGKKQQNMDGTNGKYKVDSSDFVEGENEIEVVVMDKSGNRSSDSYKFSIDTTVPEKLAGSIEGDYKEYDGVVYFKKSPEVALGAVDTGVGLSGFRVNGEPISGAKFNITGGKFKVSAVDKLGNSTEPVSVNTLIGTNGDTCVIDGRDPVVKESSGFSEDLKYDGLLWFAGKPRLVYSVSDPNILSVVISVNGERVPQSINERGEYLVDLSGVSDGEVAVGVTALDRAGNTSSDNYTFMLDTSAPVGVSASISRDFRDIGGVMYFDGAPTVSVRAVDPGIGVVEYIVGSEKNSDGKFELGNGTYTVKVRDRLGNTSSSVGLGKLVGGSSDTVVVDTSAPSIAEESGFEGNYTEDGKIWYSGVPEFTYTVRDAYLYRVTAYVNGKSFKYSDPASGEFKVDLSGISDGKNTVRLVAEDKAGNTSEKTFEFYLDRKSPKNLKASVNEEYNNFPNGAFFKKVPILTLEAEDDGVGVSKYSVNGVKKANGTYSLTGGTYMVCVEDKLGNSTVEVDLATLLGLSNSNIIVDGVAPSINKSSGFSSDLTKDNQEWYSKIPNLVFSVRDAHIRDIEIKVNGSRVYFGVEESGKYSVDTSKYVEGANRVEVTARDYSGNTRVDSYTFYLDRTAPVDIRARLRGEYTERDTGAFFKRSPEVTISATDAGVGVGTYSLNGEERRDGVYRLATGKYTVGAVDLLGNSSFTVPLERLLGFKSDRIVVDGIAPTIRASKPSGGVDNWYKEDQTYNVTVIDNVAVQEATIRVNGKVVDKFESSGTDVSSVSLVGRTAGVSADSDGSYKVEVRVTDKAGNTSEWNDTIYIDKDKPKVTRFVFNGATISGGSEINGSGRYGFFFSGGGSVEIHCDDGRVGSGLKEVEVVFSNKLGGGSTRNVAVVGGVANVSIPAGFRGTVSARAIDRVGNVGDLESPDGIVSENSNWHNNSVELSMSLPETSNKDSSGLPLYKSAVNISATVGCKASGIRSIRWGVDGTTLGTTTVDANGRISGGGSIRESDNNLILSMNNVIPVNENSNNLRVWVEVTDRLGNTSETSRNISIDLDSPVVIVNYDTPVGTGQYYNSNKVARIEVADRNLLASGIKIVGTAGRTSNWVKNGYKWSTVMVFDEDKEYDWSLVATDMAGNSSRVYNSPKFVVDKEAPKVRFEYDNQEPVNGKYYQKVRKIRVIVDDFNFDPESVKFTGKGELGDWVRIEDSYHAVITCAVEGEYKMSFSCADKSGNKSEVVESEDFIIDTVKPTLKVEGVSDGVSYKRNVKIDINFSDKNLDESEVRVSLVGKKNGAVKVDGDLDKESGSYHLEGFPDDEKYDDVYTLRVHVGDMAGNEDEVVSTFSLNRYGSHYSSDGNNVFGKYINKPEDIVIKEENVDRLDTKKCKVVVIRDGKTLNVDDSAIHIKESESTSGWSYEYTIDKSVLDSDGMYQVQIYSSSEDGTSYSSVSEEYSFVLDSSAPEVVLSGIEDNSVYREYRKKVTVDVRDLSGVDTVVARVNGKEVSVSEDEGIYWFEVTESKDIQNLTVEVTDKAGNVTVSGVSGFYLSTDPLVFLVNQPWFRFGVGVAGAVVLALIALIARGIYMGRVSERKSMLEQKELLDKSRSSSSGDDEEK